MPTASQVYTLVRVGRGGALYAPYLVLHGEEAVPPDALQGEGLDDGPLLHHEHVELLHVSWSNMECPRHHTMLISHQVHNKQPSLLEGRPQAHWVNR